MLTESARKVGGQFFPPSEQRLSVGEGVFFVVFIFATDILVTFQVSENRTSNPDHMIVSSVVT